MPLVSDSGVSHVLSYVVLLELLFALGWKVAVALDANICLSGGFGLQPDHAYGESALSAKSPGGFGQYFGGKVGLELKLYILSGPGLLEFLYQTHRKLFEGLAIGNL